MDFNKKQTIPSLLCLGVLILIVFQVFWIGIPETLIKLFIVGLILLGVIWASPSQVSKKLDKITNKKMESNNNENQQRQEASMNPGITRELTYGEKAVGITFNPGGDEKVNEVKALYAKIIDICDEMRNAPIGEGQKDSNDRNRLLSVAITQAQIAQMCAVKGITYKY